jgi:predicted O-methyltransferase YrrM
MRVFEQGSSLKEAREDREYRSLREERMEGFLSSLTDPLENYPELMSIEEACLEKYVPLIRPSMQRFLSFEMKARRPKRILEIGTAVGFSSILMAKNLLEFSDDFHIDTIENFNVRIPEAEANFKACGVEDYITLHFGDAGEILRLMGEEKKQGDQGFGLHFHGPYDLIFMDAAKGQYPVWLPLLKDLMEENTLLITDNVLQEGELVESHFAIHRRNRTIHKRVREYLYALTHDEDLQTEILPIGDGLALTVLR